MLARRGARCRSTPFCRSLEDFYPGWTRCKWSPRRRRQGHRRSLCRWFFVVALLRLRVAWPWPNDWQPLWPARSFWPWPLDRHPMERLKWRPASERWRYNTWPKSRSSRRGPSSKELLQSRQPSQKPPKRSWLCRSRPFRSRVALWDRLRRCWTTSPPLVGLSSLFSSGEAVWRLLFIMTVSWDSSSCLRDTKSEKVGLSQLDVDFIRIVRSLMQVLFRSVSQAVNYRIMRSRSKWKSPEYFRETLFL